MKKLILTLFAVLGFTALAEVAHFSVRPGEIRTYDSPARLDAIRVLSTVADGTATLKAESTLYSSRDAVTTTTSTNTTYSVVYSNGVNIVTNTVRNVAEVLPLPTRGLLSFTTNNVISTVSVTNRETYAALVVTNTLGTLTCSGGRAFTTCTNTFVCPGDRLFTTGTAKGETLLILGR